MMGAEKMLYSRLDDIVADVEDECAEQHDKWGVQEHSQLYWLGILVEEVGEVAKAIIEAGLPGRRRNPATVVDLRTELVQVAAVAISMIACLDRVGVDGK